MFRNRLPSLRIGVMSAEPPPSVKREPLAKSAPSVSALTKRSISSGSAEPSASNMTTMSPVTRAKPAARALPLPLRAWRTVMMPGHRAAGRGDRAVDRAAVDEDDLVDLRQLREDDRQVQRLVLGRHHDADARRLGGAAADELACVVWRPLVGKVLISCDPLVFVNAGPPASVSTGLSEPRPRPFRDSARTGFSGVTFRRFRRSEACASYPGGHSRRFSVARSWHGTTRSVTRCYPGRGRNP